MAIQAEEYDKTYYSDNGWSACGMYHKCGRNAFDCECFCEECNNDRHIGTPCIYEDDYILITRLEE